ncbi:MAG: acyl-CoA thioesterase [Parvularcula sp.]|jgi:acyl-CoA thioesterase YciA|nr:acyl-CoA thioesterase [Parvularcula sp.]
MSAHETPEGELTVRVMPMPADLNSAGDVFGGWVMSQMDLGSSVLAVRRAKGRVATVAVDSMHFVRPVKVGDIFNCYCRIVREGRTSMTIRNEAWVERQGTFTLEKVTQADFTFVALDHDGRPTPLPPEKPE